MRFNRKIVEAYFWSVLHFDLATLRPIIKESISNAKTKHSAQFKKE